MKGMFNDYKEGYHPKIEHNFNNYIAYVKCFLVETVSLYMLNLKKNKGNTLWLLVQHIKSNMASISPLCYVIKNNFFQF